MIMKKEYFFKSGDIYLPNKKVPYEKWAVIACDQYTSSISYWDKVNEIVGKSPSTLRLIYPEVYLNIKSDLKIEDIFNNMDNYLKNEVVVPSTKDGLVLVERETSSGKRIGVIGLIDLEQYSFTDNTYPIIATEDIVKNRLDTRIEIRNKANIELPHTILFIIDENKTIIEEAYKECLHEKPIYDFDLMMNGGHIRGFELKGDIKDKLLKNINNINDNPKIIVGDGNHSLATAKLTYERYKENHSDYKTSPLRYTLVEIENLFSNEVGFFPIHRFIFNIKIDELIKDFNDYINKFHIKLGKNKEAIFVGDNKETKFGFSSSIECIKIIQDFVEYKKYNVDYPHELDEINELLDSNKGCAITLNSIDRKDLLNWIKNNGHLPKKSFSIGKANDKKFYLESRKIR